MMRGERLKLWRWVLLLGIIGFVATIPCTTYGVSVSCMMEYDRGGAPAVYASPECGRRWVLSRGFIHNHTFLHNCQFATLQGRREYQEDRVACNLDDIVLLPGENGLENVTVGVAAIFDGHGGKEASEMASNFLFDYFHLHVAFQSYKVIMKHKGVLSDYRALHRVILKEALSKTIHDIDRQFSKAYESTADLLATQLTVDHSPDREDERLRIELAGGSVTMWKWTVPRVNGILAMSRSIGDLYLKRYGVIAEPDITDWQHITANDRYLVVSSDGIFESLTKRNVADLIVQRNLHVQGDQRSKLSSSSSCSSSSSLAECIVNVAYEKGSHDNLSVIVVPLR
ncbi:hypothetical protein Tsubulata_047021 [Turnera subulata]|uniref:PPM-type phosphatase domain-containing protein n=1 Tax=Turnera subulata TaxID=218843 RepID=A0A9Q0GGR7_9ROSI|nr:hypothetical protein Tsubulata_047021 [Turnera subulata]